MTLSCLGAIKTVLTLPARHSAPLARLQERKSGLTSVDSCIQVTSHTTDISQDWPWAWRRLARPCSSPTKAGLLALDPLVPLAAWGLVLKEPNCGHWSHVYLHICQPPARAVL